MNNTNQKLKISIMKKIVLLIMLTAFISSAYGQKRVVYGKVDYVNYPVQNVIVTAKKSKASVTTDVEGKFVIACEKNDVLTFKTESFYPVKKRIRYLDTVLVHLVIKPGIVNEESVIANNYLSAEDFEVALTKAKNQDNQYAKYSSIYEVIKAKFPYAKIEGERVILRGKTSMTLSNAAIFVLNGTVVKKIDHVHPSTIESIDVLSSTEGVIRYGGSARNGVVVIKTKTTN